MRCRKTRSAHEDDRGHRVPPTGPPTKRAKKVSIHLKFRQHLPCTGRFPKPAKNYGAKADNHNGAKADNHSGTKIVSGGHLFF